MTSNIDAQLNAISEAARWQAALDVRDELAGTLRALRRGAPTDEAKANLDAQLTTMHERVKTTNRDDPGQVAELVSWLGGQLHAARGRAA